MGRAVVSTTIGAEGLPVRNGEHIAIADEPRAFADAVLRLMRGTAERQRIGAAARQLVVSQYDWAAAAAELERGLIAAARAPHVTQPEGAGEPALQTQGITS
jgi:glycosyltransferase involved in cell wall biosynthesis